MISPNTRQKRSHIDSDLGEKELFKGDVIRSNLLLQTWSHTHTHQYNTLTKNVSALNANGTNRALRNAVISRDADVGGGKSDSAYAALLRTNR
jgi:hypothetical protein